MHSLCSTTRPNTAQSAVPAATLQPRQQQQPRLPDDILINVFAHAPSGKDARLAALAFAHIDPASLWQAKARVATGHLVPCAWAQGQLALPASRPMAPSDNLRTWDDDAWQQNDGEGTARYLADFLPRAPLLTALLDCDLRLWLQRAAHDDGPAGLPLRQELAQQLQRRQYAIRYELFPLEADSLPPLFDLWTQRTPQVFLQVLRDRQHGPATDSLRQASVDYLQIVLLHEPCVPGALLQLLHTDHVDIRCSAPQNQAIQQLHWPQARNLHANKLRWRSLQVIAKGAPQLRSLSLERCQIDEPAQPCAPMPNLVHLRINHLRATHLPDGVGAWQSLTHLSLSHLPMAHLPPAWANLAALQRFSASSMPLESLSGAPMAWHALVAISISHCPLRSMPDTWRESWPQLTEVSLRHTQMRSWPAGIPRTPHRKFQMVINWQRYF